MTDNDLITSLQAARFLARLRLDQPFGEHEWMWQSSLRDCEATLAACVHYYTLSRADPDGEFARNAKRILPRFDCKAVVEK